MALEHDSDSALAKAVRAAGSQSAFGRLLGKTQSVVHDWLRDGKELPGEHVFEIEGATGVSRHELRLDLYPREGCCAEQCPELGDSAPLQPPAVPAGAAGDSSDSRAASAAAQPPAGSGPLPAGGSHTPDALAGVRS